MFALTNPDVSCGGSVVDYFLFLNYAAFGDDYRVNRDCARIRNRASAGEAVSALISKSAATQFSVMIIESTGITESRGVITEATRTVRAYGTKHQLGKRFRRQFTRRQRLCFR
jgi:acyl-coenzyme A synthetase/AMP-(fatty) acid ligase